MKRSLSWFAVVIALIMLISAVGSVSAKDEASPLYWPNDFHVVATCEGATAVSDVPIGTTYHSGGKTWTLYDVSVSGGQYNGNGKASGSITFKWRRWNGLWWVTNNESENWSANKPADCDRKIDICHATSSETNPYVQITVDFNGLNGHGDHPNDIIPAPAEGCPVPPPPVDVCNNIEGNQATMPEGYESDGNGGCVQIPPPVDVCNNIEGNQATMPEGYESDGNGGCVPIVPPECPNGDLNGEAPGCETPPTEPPVVVLGCTDPAATINYNPLATQDDGSCQYPQTPKWSCPIVYDMILEYPPSNPENDTYWKRHDTAIRFWENHNCQGIIDNKPKSPITGSGAALRWIALLVLIVGASLIAIGRRNRNLG